VELGSKITTDSSSGSINHPSFVPRFRQKVIFLITRLAD
jgi:hypothetical protein